MYDASETEHVKLNGAEVNDLLSARPIWRQIAAASGTILLTVSAGCTSGFSAVLLPQLESSGGEFTIDITMTSWVAAISCLPLFIGNIAAALMMEKFGRRLSQLILAIPYITGWIIIGFASNIHFILLGRFITGLCQGLLGPLGPVYVGEISTPKYRGFLLAALSLSIAVGVLASHIFGICFHWKLAAILCGIFPTIAYLILLQVPESPSWLATKGRLEECSSAFKWYRGCREEANVELSKLIQSSEKRVEETESFITQFRGNIRKPEFRKPLQVMTVFFIITQLTGTNVICAYTTTIMKPLIGSSVSEYLAVLMVDVLRCVALVGACILTRRVGRRPLAIWSGGLTAIVLISLAVYIYCVRTIGFVLSPMVTVGLMSAYIAISSSGVVILPWTMVGETFPAATRGLGSGISVMMTSVAFFALVKTAPYLFHDFGLDGTFLFYGVCTLAGTVFLYFNLPETKGKTLLQVEESFVYGRVR